MTQDAGHKKAKPLSRIALLLGLLVVLGGLSVWQWRGHIGSAQRSPTEAAESSGKAALAAQLDREAAKLAGAPKHASTIYAQGLALRADIDNGDFAGADKIMRAVFQRTRILAWHFDPFATLMSYVANPGNAVFTQHVDEWVAQEPEAAFPRIVRAEYAYNVGWLARGGRFSDKVLPDNMRTFQANLAQAAADAEKAAQLDQGNPYTAYLLLKILGADGNTEAMDAAFKKAIGRFPDYYPLYFLRLRTLQPKWGGSVQAMYAFVDSYAGKAAADKPIRLLYVQLYADLLNAASINCGDESGDALAQCVEGGMSELVTARLEQNAYAALKLYFHTDKVRFSDELGGILESMIMTSGGGRYAGAFLQLAANVMGSNNQLSAQDTSKNSYMTDDKTGLVWYRQGNYANAETMYRRALADLAHTGFGDKAELNSHRASIYEDLASVYNRRDQYRKVVVYEKAADLVAGGPGYNGPAVLCAAQFKLKLYADAVRSCTATIDNGGSLQASYWRGRAYESMHRTRMAVKDFQRVAGSESDFRSYAAIRLSVIYGGQKKFAEMIRELDKYTYLYDPTLVDRESIAIAYNNRCYAKMKLGKLQAALNDCTASLRYGNLPDAYSKQQRLIELLKKQGTAM